MERRGVGGRVSSAPGGDGRGRCPGCARCWPSGVCARPASWRRRCTTSSARRRRSAARSGRAPSSSCAGSCRSGTRSASSRLVPFLTLDFAEAAWHAGRTGEARAHVAVMRDAGCARLSTRAALITAGAEAVVTADDAEAARLFERALALPGAARRTWERGPGPARLRPQAAARPGPAGGAGPARRGAGDLRAAGRGTVGRAGRARAEGHRARPRPPGSVLVRADRAGAHDRRSRRARPHQQADRRQAWRSRRAR